MLVVLKLDLVKCGPGPYAIMENGHTVRGVWISQWQMTRDPLPPPPPFGGVYIIDIQH